MRYAVQFGYYSGWFAGIMVDKLPTFISGLSAGGLSALSFATLGLISTTNWTTGVAILTIVYLVVAGYAAGIATISSMVHIILNFNRVIAILPIALVICYMKLAPAFDEAVRTIIFPDADLISYFLYQAAITAAVYIISSIFCRKIDMTIDH